MRERHPIHRVTGFAIVAPYTLSVTFQDGTTQVIDLEPMLRGELYGPLHDEALFTQVTLDQQAGTLVWPNGADFDPTTLHDWPIVRTAMLEMAARWA